MSLLKQVLDNEGITQAELSREAGVNTTTIYYMIQGQVAGKKVNPKTATKRKVINAINRMIGSEVYTVDKIFPLE